MSVARSLADIKEASIDEIFAPVNQSHQPGAVVGLAAAGRPIYRKGFGLANVELPVMLSPSIRMRIGSTTKQFTACTYLMLCEAGLAGIDDPIAKHLPELNPVTHKVTMRQLMGNTSGLRDATDLLVQFSGGTVRRVTTDELLAFYRDIDDTSFGPGTSYNYNNGGWIILSAVIERITGQPLEAVMWERVFKPIGMYDTLLRRWDSTYVPNSASCHTLSKSGGYERNETVGGIDFAGAGAMASTVDDMLRWMAHMDAPHVGTAETWQLMKTPQRLLNGCSTGYGLGLQIAQYRGVENIQHGGGGYGSNVQMLKVPAVGLDLIVMVNRSDDWSFTYADRILDTCIPELDPARKPQGGPFVEGVYRSPSTGRVVYLRRDNEQQMAFINGHPYPFEPDAEGVLRTCGYGSQLGYSIRRIGHPLHPAEIELDDFGNSDRLVAVGPPKVPGAGPVAGTYRSDTTGTQLTISSGSGGVEMRSTGRFGAALHHLECLAEDIWQTRPDNEVVLPQSGLLSFDDSGRQLFFTNAMNRKLRFRRID